MFTENVAWFPCSPARAFHLARHVEHWPALLPHYRRVRFHRGGPAEGGLVEMSARRDFGPIPWPVWWASRMTVDEGEHTICYTHLAGVTRGMEVDWRIEPAGSFSRVVVLHSWSGGPDLAGPAADYVGRRIIGPHFVHHIAAETLKYLAYAAAREEGLAWTNAGQ
jgi:ribosome-associated toxin RatA of RatAB toxin-antitoxin module